MILDKDIIIKKIHIMRHFSQYLMFCLFLAAQAAHALPLSPIDEPRADSFYICYEKRCPNDVSDAPVYRYVRYKYIGCIISKTPCHLYCGDKFHANPGPLKQFQWTNNYRDALDSFYRCAYN